MKHFSEFLGRQDRENKEHLEILGSLLKKAGFRVEEHANDRNDPYVFVHKPSQLSGLIESLSFEGVRIFTRGKDLICFRVANKPDTEPYGSSYQVDIKGMFRDMLGETHKKEMIGHEIAKYIIQEFKNFFIQSAEAEKETEPDKSDPMGSAVAGTATGTDYSNQVTGNYRTS